jgi:hypothetical protein
MDRIFISDVTWEVIVNCVHVHIYTSICFVMVFISLLVKWIMYD